MARLFEIVGEVLGPAALDDVHVAARGDRDIAETLSLDEFAGLRQRHSDWLDQLAAEPPSRPAWDPMKWLRQAHELSIDNSDCEPVDEPTNTTGRDAHDEIDLALDDEVLCAA